MKTEDRADFIGMISRFDCSCDPLKLAESKDNLERVSLVYKDINLFAFKLLRSGGRLFTFFCSDLMKMELFQKIVADAAADSGRDHALAGAEPLIVR